MKNNFFNIKKIGTGLPLVLLHGWGFHAEIFSPLVPLLEKEFELILVDLPGFGKSRLSSDQDYDFLLLIARLSEIVPQAAYWLGWSLGGLLTAGVALHYPGKVRGLIQMATTPCFVAHPDWPGVPLATLHAFYKNLMQDTQKTLTQFMALQVFQVENHKVVLEKIKQQMSLYPPNLKALMQSVELLKTVDLRAEMSHIYCPVLAIFGRLDALVPCQVAAFMQTAMPQAKIVMLPQAGHIPFLSHPEECVREIKQYVL